MQPNTDVGLRPPYFLTGKREGAIELVKEYMKNQDERMKLSKLNAPLPESIHNEHDDLSYKMIKVGIFECSRQCTECFWEFLGEWIFSMDITKQYAFT